MEKIVVSGLGIISSIGVGVDQTFTSLLESRSGISTVRHLQTGHNLPCGEVDKTDEELREICGIDQNTIITRTTLLGIIAAREAIEMGQLKFTRAQRVAFISGTTVGGMDKSEKYYLDFIANDLHNHYIRTHDCGSCTTQIANAVGQFDMITTTSTACSSATNAMIMGANLLKANVVDVVVAGGAECLTKFHLNGFKTLMILDEQPCRPLCATRAGLNLGEGAAYFVMERASVAAERGVTPLCTIEGYGNACDAYHQTASSPEGKGATLAMNQAIQMAGISAHQVDYINAHGTATPNNDQTEARAIVNVFGQKTPYVSSTKAHTGHTTSAAGAVEGVISILAIIHRFIPPTLNHLTDMESPIRVVKELITDASIRYVMSNSFGFGGNNSSIIFGRCI